MESNTSFNFEVSKNESGRIPSPASVSSIHSIRPLEWDSGADIGYEFKQQSNLSTVERIAFQSGTVNFFESSTSQDASKHSSRSRHSFAQSSPFNLPVAENILTNAPLVDYSTCLYDEAETDAIFNMDRVSKLRSDEISRSLDDLRSLRNDRVSKTSSRSRSSQNLLMTLQKSLSEKMHSSSSAATLVPQCHELQVHRYSNKATQVDEMCLADKQKKTSSFEFFRRVSNDESNENDSGNPARSNSENADGESVDNGSFEYVPGSVYASQELQSKGTSNRSWSSGSVNTLCSEVTTGVALLTKYVSDLNVSKKRQVMEKVAKSLMSNLSNLSRLKELPRASLVDSNVDELLLDTSPELQMTTSTYSRLRKRNSVKQNSKSGSSNYLESRSSKNSHFPATTSEDSNRLPTSMNSFRNGLRYSRSSSAVEVTSSCRIDSNSDLKSSNSNQKTYSAQSYSLKEYLKKERETQLLWIKSNIDHLNNLRKLCESQKLLRSELNTLKKLNCVRSSKETPQSDVTECHSARNKHLKLLSKNRPVCKPKITSDVSSNATSVSSHVVLSTSGSVNKGLDVQRPMEIMKKKKRSETDNDVTCKKCSKKSSKHISENKENFSHSNINELREKSITRRKSKSAPSKPAISYTVLFDKEPHYFAAKTFKVKERVLSKSVSRATNKGKKMTRTKFVTEFRNTSDDEEENRIATLQDYLMLNKPDYINRADYRRQCLAEIAKLRELRDKSREELLLAVRNEKEMNDDVAKIVTIPPPLSIVRIFDDKTMKRETERKYQQLPEVQSKKLELKRKDLYRRNHIMAKVFAKKLQKKVLRGQVNLGNDVNIMSI